ncbi:Ankyrin repeat-containing domain [Phytophthora cactorum]|nr:Ankyrin repeat-containing domain [Phytophthora cactorum]
MIELRNHPLIPDGTKQVFLSKAACESVMLSVFDSARCFRYDESRRIAAPSCWLDTITLDSKVDKFVALYAEQERSLRNQKIELMKMERSNTNNQFRVQIRLLQNQIRLQEQELQHTQNKITDGENLVNNVWKEVIAVKSPPKQSVVRDLTRTGEYSLPSKELISVLGRFEAHIGRLQKKHGIAVKASMLLAVPWQQQMEELRLQRYGASSAAFEGEKEQEDKQKREVEENKRNWSKKLEKKRPHTCRSNEEKELPCHESMEIFVVRKKNRRKANLLFLKFKLMKWKLHLTQHKRMDRAARTIQHFIRQQKEQKKLRRLINLRVKRTKTAKKYLLKVQSRMMNRLFNHWAAFTVEQQRLRENFAAIIQRREEHWFQRWVGFVDMMKTRKLEAAILIQRQYRGLVARQVLKYQRDRHRKSVVFSECIEDIEVERMFRGFLGRKAAQRRRWEMNAAIQIQTVWRRHKAKKYVVGVRTEKILLATYKGDYTTVKRAIVNGFWYVLDNEGNSILHLAAAAGHKRLVKLCLRNSFDINLVNYHNQTALHLLLANLPPSSAVYDVSDVRIRDERVALAEYMIEHGAWHEAPDEEGFTPLLLCASLGQSEAVDMLLNHGANTEARTSGSNLNAPQLAVEGNYSATLKVLLESGSFDTRDTGRITEFLLHACAGRGLIDCVRVLVDHIRQRLEVFGYDALNLCDSEGYTPLVYAVSNGYLDATECLLEADAGPDVKDYFGRSPLHFALISADASTREALVNLLIQYEADVNVKDTDGDAPLHVSCVDDDRLACTHLLLTSGAWICANALGNHPTHIAARNGAVDTLKLLIDYGGDMNLKNYDGKTPLGMARMNDQIAVADFVAAYFAQESADKKSATSPELEPVEDDEGNQEDHERSDNQNDGLLEQNLEDKIFTRIGRYQSGLPQSRRPLIHLGTPVEFDASMGEIWEIVRGPSTVAALDEEQDPSSADSRYYLYHNRVTDELTSTIPPINYALLQDVVQNSKRMKLLRARVRKRQLHLKRRLAARELQRIFRGFTGRKLGYREKVIQRLGPKSYFEWEALRKRAKVARSFKVWDEMEAHDFPGVLFYCHQVTRACSWQQPPPWVQHDRKTFENRLQLVRWGYTEKMQQAAQSLQRLWRARVARISFQMVIRAVRLMRTCEQEYLEDPTHLVKMGNYVLHVGSGRNDFTWEDSGSDTVKYKVAFLGFFRQAILQNPLDAEAHINYAACVQWLFEQYEEATAHYLQALALAPQRKGTIELFQNMLDHKRRIERAMLTPRSRKALTKMEDAGEEEQFDAFAQFRRWQAKQAEEEDRARRMILEAEQDFAIRQTAARKIQARYRRRNAMRKVTRLRLEYKLAAVRAEEAQQQALYDRITVAFEDILSSSTKKKKQGDPGPVLVFRSPS